MAGIYKSTNNGDSWTAVLTATLPAYDIIINDLGDIFVSSIDAMGVLRSIDNGATWQQINSGLYSYNIRCLCLSPNTFLLGGGEGTGVWLSGLPTGSNLFGGNGNLGLPIQYGVPIQNVTVIHSNPGPYNSPSSDYPIDKVSVTLQEINHPDISELIVTLEHEGIVDTLVYQPGISGANFLSTKFKDDASLELSQGTPPFVGSFKPHNPLSVFNSLEATGEWILKITDQVPANDGIFEAWSISILSDLSSDVQDLNEIPSGFALFQNYPNPFNPSTKINYIIPTSEFVSLKIYDVLGNEVKTLVNEEKPAGTFETEFSGDGLSSGIYFYRLQSGSFIETKKMILLK
jgi:subtilisin-like proprotein convertase family protein